MNEIRPALKSDAAAIAEIYNYYVLETIITFEEEAVTVAEMEQRIAEISAAYPWIVFEEDDKVLGYAYASGWKSRCAYRNSVETTVYLHPDAVGKGAGTKLYKALLNQLWGRGMHTAIGGIALPNAASIALHEKMGFHKVAEFQEVGFKFNQWINVGYWQVLIGEGDTAK